MTGARIRLASLWVSQTARVLADHCLRMFVILTVAQAGRAERESVWHLVVVLFALPSIVLAPLNGTIGNSLPKRGVLVGAAAFCLTVTAAFAPLYGACYALLALVAVGSALYSPVRYALLPAAARDTRIPLPRVNGLIEMGTAAAIVGGMILGGLLSDEAAIPGAPAVRDAVTRFRDAVLPVSWGVPLAIAAVLGLSALATLAALPVRFASDVRRPEAPRQAVAGFFRDSVRILRQQDSRGTMLAWSGFRGLVAVITGAFIAEVLSREGAAGPGERFGPLLGVALWIMGGAAAGSLLAGVQGHPRRSLGLVPLGFTGLGLTLLWAAATGSNPGVGLCLVVGVLGGLINVPLFAAYQDSLPADARGNGLSVLYFVGYLFITAMSLLMFGLARTLLSAAGQMWVVAGLTALAAALAWRAWFRDSLEQVLELVLWPVYRIRAHGPGKFPFPRRGPVLVVANHSSWFDPLWLAKVLPRRLTPMMTSVFYDMPGLRWLMVHVVHAIRVQSSSYRREAPELREAIAALDRGECVVIFPEGMLRRRADLTLRPFGQGVWHILRERPETPVVVCWIEGGWGSYMSYCNGPPLANKRPDWWRHIDVAVAEPLVIEPALLRDDRLTRSYLCRACLETRRLLGLSVPAKLPAGEREPALAAEGCDSSEAGERAE